MKYSLFLLALFGLLFSDSAPVDPKPSSTNFSFREFFLTVLPIFGLLVILSAAALCFRNRYKKKKNDVNRTSIPESISLDDENSEQAPLVNVESPETTREDIADRQDVAESQVFTEPSNDRSEDVKTTKMYQIGEHLKLEVYDDRLGKGQFGVVHKGRIWNGSGKDENDESAWKDVAVKRCPQLFDKDQRNMLEQELKAMREIKIHPNVLTFVGTTKVARQRLIISEYVDGGCLLDFLRERREKFESTFNSVDGELLPRSKHEVVTDSWDTVTPFDLQSFMYQIANGMEYLVRAKIVHRDLALRNVLIRKNKVIRIADFELARVFIDDKIYYRPSGDNPPVLPIHHIAPEWLSGGSQENLDKARGSRDALDKTPSSPETSDKAPDSPEAPDKASDSRKNEIFSEKTDVWAYGVCLYEIISLGGKMYKGQTYHTLGPWLQKGNRLKIPESCHPDVADLIGRCWNIEPKERPSFALCKEHLEKHLRSSENQLLEKIEEKLQLEMVDQLEMEEWLGKTRDGS